MDEQTKEEPKEEPKEKQPATDTGEGDKPQAPGLNDGANAAAERLEKATQEMKKENDRQEEITAKRMLGGRSETVPQIPKAPETDEEYTARFVAGEVNPLKGLDGTQ